MKKTKEDKNISPERSHAVSYNIDIKPLDIINSDRNTGSDFIFDRPPLWSVRINGETKVLNHEEYLAYNHEMSRELLTEVKVSDVAHALKAEGADNSIIQKAISRLEVLQKQREREKERLAETSLAHHLPDSAPVKWADKEKYAELANATPSEFIRHVYKEYLGKGITTGYLDKLDTTLYEEHRKLPPIEKVSTSLLPDREAEAANRRLPTEEELRDRREQERFAARERKRRQREREKQALPKL